VIAYLDTSSLVKLYIDESGSEEVRHLVERATAAATCVIAYPETRSAFARLERGGFLGHESHAHLRGVFDAEWLHLLRVPITESLCKQAGDLAHKHGLRGFDSVHLAAFLDLRRQAGDADSVEFSAYDAPLTLAASREADDDAGT